MISSDPNERGKDQQKNPHQMLEEMRGKDSYLLLRVLQMGTGTVEIGVEDCQRVKNKSTV